MKLKYYLIPSELNNYKPWIISPAALGLFCLVIWALRFLLPGISIAASSIDAGELMTKINLERTQRFIPALTTNDKLITAATGKAQDMLARSYFAHVDPDGNYVWPRIEAAGYTPYLTLGENLAMDFTSADAVVQAWMNSPTHRENIENAKFEDQGLASIFGTFEPGHDTIMVTSLFGTLYKTTTTPTPANPPPVPAAPSAPKSSPSPAPATPAAQPDNTPAAPALEIYPNAKISSTIISGHILVNVDLLTAGDITLVTGRLKTQSITLLPGQKNGEYLGGFTFDPTENLADQTMSIEARDRSGKKTSLDFPVNILSPAVSGDSSQNQTTIPVSNEANIITILRVVFGIFALIYMVFLIIDAIIIRRAKINRPGIHTSTHTLLFLLIAMVSIFTRF